MELSIQTNISLKPYNTFGLDVKAAHFCSVTTEDELRAALLSDHPRKFILGGGSNMLLTKDLDALVIHIGLRGIEILENNKENALVRVAAGENWHDFVLWAIGHDLGGVENLSLIPGNTGTAPVQNIGAYGVELKDVFHSCDVMHRETGKKETFSLEQCKFGYRDSVFKTTLKDQYVITSVVLKLSRPGYHKLNTGYGAIKGELQARNIQSPGIADISRAVIAIRQSKLPDPAKLGNSGSFFKNPVVGEMLFKELQESYPEIPHYPAGQGQVKIPAGWLIEQSGLKGFRKKDAGIHKNQALVLVNHGKATGKELLELAEMVQEKVFNKFGISIRPEVNIF
ncbi:UDP-N-acetylmuramate dehydrogenase [Robertkochia marina]|uniref:UDP-N-acetylenolpyruvoylglucosamine reductase n=1 Tax=Robertkochia marina TaxID=1227945 RepID=A0A4S3LYY0_9FLAO|nr:UDP-N-acetylmuramate dehydrogenase [Robertkochia marina]THD66361.1 UDP-N-acetylmuramate dehydrogenase [Robertkochia marina]TRZ44042.1 UDP-N-acetylmuramate dehydrogenase [Robertkochia marina]